LDEGGKNLAERKVHGKKGIACQPNKNDKAILINDAIAIAAMNYVHKLLMREPIQSFVTYVDLTTNNTRSVPLTRENLRKHIQQRSTSP